METSEIMMSMIACGAEICKRIGADRITSTFKSPGYSASITVSVKEAKSKSKQ